METKRKKTSTDDAKILTVPIAIIVLLVIFAGATFAYFAFNASNNNVITGEVGTVNLSLNVSKVLPNKNKQLFSKVISYALWIESAFSSKKW